MKLLQNEIIGRVENVDTTVVFVRVQDDAILSTLQVNQFVMIQSILQEILIVGMIHKIIKIQTGENEQTGETYSNNIIKVILVGTFRNHQENPEFKRNIDFVPNVNAYCYSPSKENLTMFMESIVKQSTNSQVPLVLGKYSLSQSTEALLHGDRFFQRHAVIVGSTGSGKSWTVAKLVEQVANLSGANAIIMDIHGEYASLEKKGIHHYKIAGPSDIPSESLLFLPYWFLSYEEMLALILQQKETSAQNQTAAFNELVLNLKKAFLESTGDKDLLSSLTVETPIPYSLKTLMDQLKMLDSEMVEGSRGEKKGPYNGLFTKVIERMQSRIENKRFNFLFQEHPELMKMDYLTQFIERLMLPSSLNKQKGIKIIDFSEVPSDVLPLAVSLISRLVFSIQQWSDAQERNPIAIFCDEAHLYMSQEYTDSIERLSLDNFHRIAKEGRKYGVSLITITQRPSEVSKTILSQSNNFIVMRLTNQEDQNVIRRLIPDSIGSLLDQIPILDTGECVVIGDSSLLPSKIKIEAPKIQPNSSTINFWSEWTKSSQTNSVTKAITALQKQKKQ